MDHFFNELNKHFEGTFGKDFMNNFENLFEKIEQQQVSQYLNLNPKYNLYESENELICVMILPGLEKLENIKLKVSENIIQVRGTFKLQFTGFRLVKEELSEGEYKREIELPYAVREDKVDASYKRGLLIIHLHRLLSKEVHNEIFIQDLDSE
ncbi:Hsp20/alpha crystallin family protein [Bacillus shivajii]|uniref:Hsp20/alpha crystallin family protein n=1 Tax=Bacillus shivajii TaxID=1983719 RepID=UPI001CFB4C24|nr:Hsp20/alpha crystallin family protein [Bacillus shivajii]UCZ51457.1 Hsp20/alpha crystallin family protein [Bacillus shivajii]